MDLIRRYIFYATIPIGLIGNSISLFIFTRPNLNKKTNTGFLYSILCVLNLLTISEYAFILHSHYFNYSVKLYCHLEFFIGQSLIYSIVWMQVLICFDRFILVIFPAKSKTMAKKVNFRHFVLNMRKSLNYYILSFFFVNSLFCVQ